VLAKYRVQDVVNDDGLSPLSLAARHEKWDIFHEIIEVLLFSNFIIYPLASTPYTFLHLISSTTHWLLKIVDSLLNHAE
jgi:hypothetical protein